MILWQVVRRSNAIILLTELYTYTSKYVAENVNFRCHIGPSVSVVVSVNRQINNTISSSDKFDEEFD